MATNDNCHLQQEQKRGFKCTVLKLLFEGDRDLRCGISSYLKQEYKFTLAERDLATVLLWG